MNGDTTRWFTTIDASWWDHPNVTHLRRYHRVIFDNNGLDAPACGQRGVLTGDGIMWLPEDQVPEGLRCRRRGCSS